MLIADCRVLIFKDRWDSSPRWEDRISIFYHLFAYRSIRSLAAIRVDSRAFAAEPQPRKKGAGQRPFGARTAMLRAHDLRSYSLPLEMTGIRPFALMHRHREIPVGLGP